MLKLKTAAFLATTFCAVSSALAGAGELTTVVTPLAPTLAPKVSYSTSGTKPMIAYIGYLVKVTSASTNTNTINNIVFTGTASATDPAEKVEFASSDGLDCDTPVSTSAISCSIGQFRPGDSRTFAVFFKSPVKVDNNGVADVQEPPSDFVTFTGGTYYAEGTGGITSPPPNSYSQFTADTVALGTPSPTNVKSSVPKSGGTFFTGSGVPNSNDKFATSVNVPAAATYTAEASILEDTFTTVQTGGAIPTTLTCANFNPCTLSAVTVPGSFEYLTIILRQDASAILKGVKIETVQIWYDGSDEADDSYHGYLGPCPAPTTPLSDRPCIASSKYYKNKTVAGWTQDLDGDFEWTIITHKNGRFAAP